MVDVRQNLCCSLCQRSSNDELSSTVFCKQHQIKIEFAAAVFCRDFSNTQFPELAAFIQAQDIEPDAVYEWISGSSDEQWYSYFPPHERTVHLLATVQEYPNLTPDEILDCIMTNRARRLADQGS